MTLAWLLVEVVVGLLLAGVVLGAVVSAGAQWGLPLGVWTPWVTALACVAAVMLVGQQLRRRRRP